MTDCTALARDTVALDFVLLAASIGAALFAIHMVRKSKELLDQARRKVRVLRLGEMLLAACDEDEPAALKAVESTRALTDEFKASIGWPWTDTQ